MPHKTLYTPHLRDLLRRLTALSSLGDGTSWTWRDRTDVGSRTQPVETCHCHSI